MRKYLSDRKGEGYIDVCVGIVALMSVLVVTLNIFSFMLLRQDLDEICGQLLETAAYTGAFGDDFAQRSDDLEEQFFDFDTSVSAQEFFNTTYSRVQLGDTMIVSVSKQTYVRGIGLFHIPVTVSVTRSGISEKYWK